MKLFISHSHKDKQLVDLLIDLFRSALHLTEQDIRCTSVDGYKLPIGANIHERITRELREAECFIAVVSKGSLKSFYCIFEMGARWGTGKHFVPLLKGDASVEALREPLKSLRHCSCRDPSELDQLIVELSEALSISPASPASYAKKIDAILTMKIWI